MQLNSFELTQQADGDTLSLTLFGTIGEYWAEAIAAELSHFGNATKIDLTISSRGGNAGAAAAIYSLLGKHPARVRAEVIGFAMSAATVVLMAADERHIASNAFLMIHRTQLALDRMPAVDARKVLDAVDKIDAQLVDVYAARTGLEATQIETMLDAETYLDANEAKALGFVDVIDPAKTAAVGVDNVSQFADELPSAIATLAASWKPPIEVETMAKDTTPAEQVSAQDQLAGLQAACPGAPAAFVLEQLQANADPLAAATAWAAEQNKQLETERKSHADELAKATQAATEAAEAAQAAEGGQGVSLMQTGDHVGDDAAGDPVEGFSQLVEKIQQSGKVERIKAVQIAARRDPKLHRQYLLSQNGGRQRRRMLLEKYDVEDEVAKQE